MIKYRDILESLEDRNADGWGVLNHESDMQVITTNHTLDRLEI